MTRTILLGVAALLVGACDSGKSGTTSGVDTHVETSARPTVTATVAPTPPPPPSPAPIASAAPSDSAATGPVKVWDCGAKGQKPCPMQGWMKTTLGPAAGADDAVKLAAGLNYLVAHVPPGFSGWAAMAQAGAAKAKAGDIDGAKDSCKQCHDAYKEKYKTTMRDRPYG